MLGLASGVLLLAVAPGANAAARHDQAVLLPHTIDYACHMVEDGSAHGSYVYCWNGYHPSRHVKLLSSGRFSSKTAMAIPQGIGGPGQPAGEGLTVGRFRCDVLRAAVRCTAQPSGKGFLLSNTKLKAASVPSLSTAVPRFFSDFLNAVDANSRLVIKPSVMLLFADGKWALKGLQWTGWGSPVAHAAGTSSSYVSPGDPPVEAPAEVTLSSPGVFEGRKVYRCILVSVPPPANFGGKRCVKRVGTIHLFS